MGLAIVCSAICLAILGCLQWLRIRRIPKEFSLQPNCLLTHAPLLLLNGPQSLFYFGRYWNAIPHALREHGYETYVWQSKNRDSQSRLKEFEHFLQMAQEQRKQFHLIADSSNLALLEALARTPDLPLVSLNLVHAKNNTIERTSQDLKPAETAIVEWALPTLPLSKLERVQNMAHNAWVGRKKSIDLALLSTSHIKNWLEIAISLAEKEMKWSHEHYGNTSDTTHP